MEKDISQLGTIISKTDLNGTIIEVNEAFIKASGYSKEELLGQPHNIVRDPDVPKAVFKDMWATLQSGKPWVQIVKNRCKDGQFYWVEANMTPLMDQGNIIGYLSVRRAVTDSMKQAAQNLYKEVARGRSRLVNGYEIDVFKNLCLFNRIHPINLMVIMMGLMGGLTSLTLLGVLHISGLWMSIITLVFVLYSLAGRQYVFTRLGKAKMVMDKMREGNFTGQVDFYGGHSLSKMISSVKMMQVQLGAMVEASNYQLERSTRLKSALDSASTNVMMVNNSGKILYINNEMQRFVQTHLAVFQSKISIKDQADLVGQSIESMFDQSIFYQLDRPSADEIHVGGLIIHIEVNPVVNDNNELIGTVIEWRDLTQQRKIENNLQDTLQMASLGHVAISIDTSGLSGFYLETSNHVNDLLKELNAIIESMVVVMTNLATGDLRSRVEKDLQGSLAAMKGATNVSLDNLSAIVLYIKQAGEAVEKAASESSAAALDLSDRTQQAAATLEQINASMQMVHGLQKENAIELQSVNEMANAAMTENKTAKNALEATVASIEEIQQTSEKISNIVSLIDGIAFQTNLLALNAAVEAARAGDHGRGFAVVAGEVRSLAQKSATAAQEIKGLIDESSAKVHEGVNQVLETNQAFDVVNEKVIDMGTALDKVVLSIQEQQHSVSEVAQAVSALDSNIQSNAALVEETSAAAESLNQQAMLLGEQTGTFLIDQKAASRLIQTTPELYGVQIADVRQAMRIWRTNVQSYLNGVQVEIDLDLIRHPEKTSVGEALSKIQRNQPNIESQPEFVAVQDRHLKQHQIANQVLALMEAEVSDGVNVEAIREKDQLMDQFVETANQLDEALLNFNLVNFRANQVGSQVLLTPND